MTTFRPKTWTPLGAALLLGLSACTAGETGASQGGEGEGEGAPVPAPAASAPATVPAGVVGGESGEAGASDAYGNIPAQSLMALRIAHLKGFLLVAEKVVPAEGAEAAAVLIQQGNLEVLDPQEAAFKAAGVDIALMRKAAETGTKADIDAAKKTLDAAYAKAGGDTAAVIRSMGALTLGLYGVVEQDGAVDPVEYQHSLGAALATRDLAGKDKRFAEAAKELDALIAYWPTPSAPEEVAKLTPKSKVAAQISRAELALSGL